MKGFLLLYGVSMLVIGYATMVDGFSKRKSVLEICGITLEKDETLHKCLLDNIEKQRKATEEIKNHAGIKNYTEIHHLFKESTKCFSDEDAGKKKCYIATVSKRFGESFRQKRFEMKPISATTVYASFREFIDATFERCQINKDTAAFLFSCINDLEPEAKKIMAEKISFESFEKMITLIKGSSRCYSSVTPEQGQCVLNSSKIFHKDQTAQIYKQEGLIIQMLKDCKISEEKIETVSTCMKPKIEELIREKEKFEDPEYGAKMWNLTEEIKSCFEKHMDVKKCFMENTRDQSERKHWMNPFHFVNITTRFVYYITAKSKKMLDECKIRVKEMPSVFICLKKKYDENADVQSTEPKRKFVGMMKLMNTSAACFVNVTMEQGMCLLKNKDDMKKTLNVSAQYFGKIMDQLLGTCNATSSMVSCVNEKKITLQKLSKSMLDNPDVAETMWNLGTSLKTCLTDETIKKCVLSKNGRSQDMYRRGRKRCSSPECYGEMDMQKHIREESMKMLFECKLTPKNSPAVFKCLKKTYNESKIETLKEPKQIFISGMKLMKTSALCFENATNEQKTCLSDKKKKMQEMISDKSEQLQKMMKPLLDKCGVSKTKTPELVQCLETKHDSLKKLMPDLLNNPAIAETIWDLMEDMKKCFESKPEIGKCIKEKKMLYFSYKSGMKKKADMTMGIMERVKMVFEKCNISAGSTPGVYACLQTKVGKLKLLIGSKDMDFAKKMMELDKLRLEGLECLKNTDENRKKCVEESSASFRMSLVKSFKKASTKFDPASMMKRMDDMFAGCGITSEKTPNLKSCLDDRTDAVMKIKPWLPMTNEAREKLKAEGVKYWKCFADGQDKELKCMKKIVDGFKKQGEKYSARMGGSSMNKKMEDLIKNVTDQVLACSPNKCFREKVNEAVNKFKIYWQSMRTAGNNGTKTTKFDKLKMAASKQLFQSMFCLKDLPEFEKANTFKCLQPIVNKTSVIAKKMISNMKTGKWKGGDNAEENRNDEKIIRRKKRDTEDEDTFESIPFFALLSGNSGTENDDSSVTAFQLLLDKQNMERFQALFDLMKKFISTCSNWGAPPEAMKNRMGSDEIPHARKIIDHGGLRRLASRQIIDHGGLPARPPSDITDQFAPPLEMDENFPLCKIMYDNINSFFKNGNLNIVDMRKPETVHHNHHVSTAVIVAACTGSIIVGILILLAIIVIFISRRRCSNHSSNRQEQRPTAPPTDTPVYNAYPIKQAPPAYEATTGFSQILDTSTREGTEKSC